MFELDEHTGEERFYLLASKKRLVDFEAFVNDYENADTAKKTHPCQYHTAEIRKLRNST